MVLCLHAQALVAVQAPERAAAGSILAGTAPLRVVQSQRPNQGFENFKLRNAGDSLYVLPVAAAYIPDYRLSPIAAEDGLPGLSCHAFQFRGRSPPSLS